jgi:hypothetical protein
MASTLFKQKPDVIYAYYNESYLVIEKHPDPFRYNRVGKFIVDRFSLFPSLDGLAAYIEWLQSKGD